MEITPAHTEYNVDQPKHINQEASLRNHCGTPSLHYILLLRSTAQFDWDISICTTSPFYTNETKQMKIRVN